MIIRPPRPHAGIWEGAFVAFYCFYAASEYKKDHSKIAVVYGAGDEARTRYLHLGKVALYRMSYTRMGFP